MNSVALSLKKDISWNLIGGLLPPIAAFICIPPLLHILGNDKYGFLALLWTLIGYFSILDLGISKSLTVKVSEISKSNMNHPELSLHIQSGLTLVIILGLFFGVLSLLFLSTLFSQIVIENSIRVEAEKTVSVISAGVVATVVNSAIRGIMEGLRMFSLSNIYRSFIGVGYFVLPLLSVKLHGASLLMLSLYLVLFRIFFAGIGLLHLKQYLKGLDIGSFRRISPQLLSYGSWVTISNIISPLMVYGDRFLISTMVGVSVLSIYTIPQEGLLRLLIIPAAISGALLPRFTGGNVTDNEDLYRKNYQKLFYVSLTVCLLASFFAYPFLTVWINRSFAQDSFWIAQLFCIGIFANSCAQMPYTLLMARNMPKIIALTHVIELILYLLMLLFLLKQYGVLGAAAGWSVRAIIDWIVLNWTAKRLLLRASPIKG